MYNVASGRPTTNKEIVDAIRKVIPAFNVELPAGHMPGQPETIWTMDITRLLVRIPGFRPQFEIRSGIADYIAWLRAGNKQ